MKVRFSSRKEQDPSREGGLKVLYAPSKRVAFRLRWYLILLLVASPFLWFVGKMAMSILLIEAPGRVVQPMLEVRALEAGKVGDILVEPEDPVNDGHLLVRLVNASLQEQKAQLEASVTVPETSGEQLVMRQINNLRQRLARARARVRDLEALVRDGAATTGELNAARDTRDEREQELAQLQRSFLEPIAWRSARAKDLGQLKVVEQRLAQLSVRAPEAGRIKEVAVAEGENVGPGTLLLKLARQQEPRIYVYLAPSRIELASEGQSLQLKFPDDQWYDGRISGPPKDVERLPPDLRSPFGVAELGLLVEVTMDSPIPPQWRINNVPLTARFPNIFERWSSLR
ncbi:HlyD family secretion protein [Marinobacter orientalis]|uniref:HlyD family efflux transporter periplasmic adaptor subunit n=1 Tax=Marinobacter orientalis TaxID=1928859 RepID=A0A7Y0RCR3_9GAMM|nr:HlyD family efflux transporter periplasmic adaptor subunit [Marinobacter orientalis]NMT63838.1 HlyD family efflux transporter periplasmic adaptor subunit [Marinobacter orientalis]